MGSYTLILAALVALVAASGCYNPDLSGEGSFSCAKTGECPEGFTCIADTCVREGQSPPDARLGDGEPDHALVDGPPPDQLTQDDTSAGDQGETDTVDPTHPCIMNGSPVDVSKVNPGTIFSFDVSDKGTAAVSFVEAMTPPPLKVTVRPNNGTWSVPKIVYASGVDHSAVGFDTQDKAFIAYRSIPDNSLKLAYNNGQQDIDTTNGAGVFVTAGPHSQPGHRILSYQSGGTLKWALIKVDPTQAFFKQTYSLQTPAAIASGTHIDQGQYGSTGQVFTFAYISTGTPQLVLTLYDPTNPTPSQRWNHNVLDTIKSNLNKEDYGVSLADRIQASGPPLVWANYDTATTGPMLRYMYILPQVKDLWSGGRPSYALEQSHEAIAYVDKGSLFLRTRKTENTGTWIKPLTIYSANNVLQTSVQKVILRANPVATTSIKGVWEVVFRAGTSLSKKLFHVTVTCKY